MVQKVPSYKSTPDQIPFSTFEWVDAWHETIGKNWGLLLLSVNDEIIAPFARHENEIIFAGGDEVADYLDIVGPDEKKVQAWQEIKTYLQGTTLHLNNIPENSSTISFFKSHTSSIIKEEDTTPKTPLPPSLEKKYRHEMERKIRKFERENANIEFKEGKDIDALLYLMKLDLRKKEFLTLDMEEFFKKIYSMGTITELLIDNVPAAAMLTFSAGDTLMGYNSGFNETRFSGSGFYLKAKMLERAFNQGYKQFNFLQGNEHYKYELGGKDFFVYRIDATL